MLETMLLALLGGILGAAMPAAIRSLYGLHPGCQFHADRVRIPVSPELLWRGLKWALAMSDRRIISGLRAARMSVTDARTLKPGRLLKRAYLGIDVAAKTILARPATRTRCPPRPSPR
jgi:hypothetical protein